MYVCDVLISAYVNKSQNVYHFIFIDVKNGIDATDRNCEQTRCFPRAKRFLRFNFVYKSGFQRG